jgi:hypothetical protein
MICSISRVVEILQPFAKPTVLLDTATMSGRGGGRNNGRGGRGQGGRGGRGRG